MPPNLTELKVKALKPKEKSYRVYDEKGLYLEVSPAGGKLWRYKYRYDGKEKRLSFGPWPEVKIADARDMRDDARRSLRDGVDPTLLKKRIIASGSEKSFMGIGQEWLVSMKKVWTEQHSHDVSQRLINYVFPFIGAMPIDAIKPMDVLRLARDIEGRGNYEAAKRMVTSCSQIFRYAVATGRAESDPCRDLKGVLTPYKKKNFAAITEPDKVGGLLRAIDAYNGSPIVRHAMKFSALTFGRPGEVRRAEWSEIDWQGKEWKVPAAKMKMRNDHRVPLANQTIKLLKEIEVITGDGVYIFPSARIKDRPMSENAVLAALRSMGFTKDEMTPHGFRAMASTLLNEKGYRADLIEAQLAHKEADKVRAAYNRAQYMQERRDMMQAWADYLDELKNQD